MNIDFNQISNLTNTQVKEMLELLAPRSLKYSPHTPTPKQQVFMNLTAREAFFGGAAGGGKSDALLMDALQYVDIKGYAAIIFRKSFTDLIKPGALIDRSKEWLMPFVATGEVKWREKERKFEFLDKYGRHTDVRSVLQFGYLENENDKYNYQGGEYQYAGFDELVHMTESNYRYIFSRLRRLKGVNLPIKVRGASNPPDDDQGIWVYNRFVNPETKKKNVLFLPANMDDNPHLDAEEYNEMLKELDPVTRARLKDGNWTVIRKGNMFKRDWFGAVDAPPASRRLVRWWDMAATDEKDKKKRSKRDPDWTVGLKLSEHKGIYYIEDIIRVRKRPAETEEIQKVTAIADGKKVKVREEQEPGSSGIAAVDGKARGALKGYDYKGIKSSGSKATRANPVSAAAEQRRIKYVRGCPNIEAFFNEAESFPGGLHDDIIDALSGAFGELSTLTPTVAPTAVAGDYDEGSYWNGFNEEDCTAGYFRR